MRLIHQFDRICQRSLNRKESLPLRPVLPDFRFFHCVSPGTTEFLLSFRNQDCTALLTLSIKNFRDVSRSAFICFSMES